MLYVNWWRMALALMAMIIAIAPLVLYLALKRQRRLLRIVLVILSSPAAILAAFYLLLMLWFESFQTYSAPLLCVSSGMAARVETGNGPFSTDGDTSVFVYRFGGLSSSRVYEGLWRSVEPEDVRWTGPNTLTVQYHDHHRYCYQHPASWLAVRCEYVPDAGEPSQAKHPNL